MFQTSLLRVRNDQFKSCWKEKQQSLGSKIAVSLQRVFTSIKIGNILKDKVAETEDFKCGLYDMSLNHTAAMLSRETEKALFYHSEKNLGERLGN